MRVKEKKVLYPWGKHEQHHEDGMLGTARMSDRMGTILQVTKCAGVSRQMSFAKRLSEFFQKVFKTSILERLLLGANLQVKFHNLMILQKEGWNAEVLQLLYLYSTVVS